MRILFRFDVGGAVGFGHSSRCMAMAEALLLSGHEVFACGRFLNSQATQKIDQTFFISDGVPYTLFSGPQAPSFSPQNLIFNESEDALQTQTLATSLRADAVVIDHYGIGAEWLQVWNNAVPLVAISDGKQISGVNSIIDYGFDASLSKYSASGNQGVKVLAGSIFAPISSKYERFRLPPRQSSGSVLNCLVSLGGSTPRQEVERIQKLIRRNLSHVEFLRIREVTCESSGASKSQNHQSKAMPSTLEALFASADFSVVSAGVTMYEFLASGSSGLVLLTAENQRGAFEAAKSKNIVREFREESLEKDLKQIASEMETQAEIKRIAWLTGRSAVDTFGARRVVNELFGRSNRQLDLRLYQEWDAPFLFRLVNQPSSQRGFFSERPVTAQEHLAWFDNFKSSDGFGLILEEDHIPVGQCRLNVSDSVYKLSYSILDDYQGRGLGTAMLLKLFQDFSISKPVWAHIKPGNIASIKALQKSSFQLEISNSREVVMVRWPD